jgi:hypothetical protein
VLPQHAFPHYEIEYRNLKKEEAAARIQPPFRLSKYLLKFAIAASQASGGAPTKETHQCQLNSTS